MYHEKKKWSDEKSSRMRETFEEKVRKLREECTFIKRVEVQWECDWLRKRKSPELRDFLSSSFVLRPRRRLIPRDACKLNDEKRASI